MNKQGRIITVPQEDGANALSWDSPPAGRALPVPRAVGLLGVIGARWPSR